MFGRTRLGQRWQCQNKRCRAAMIVGSVAYKDSRSGVTICPACYQAQRAPEPATPRACYICEADISDKPEHQITCSRGCGAKLRAQSRRAADMADRDEQRASH